jgi:DNA adenine methylase
MKRFAPITWYGSKTKLVPWLSQYMPRHRRFVEPFGGSGVFTFQKEPAEESVYADVDERIVNFMRWLRDDVAALQEAIRRIEPTEENYTKRSHYRSHDDGVSGAAWLFFKCKSSYSGSPENIGGFDLMRNNKLVGYLNAIRRLPSWSQRLQNVTILHASYEQTFAAYDSSETLWFIDPPYPKAMRTRLEGYRFEMSDAQHVRLLEQVKELRGKVMLTTYLTRFDYGVPVASNTIYLKALDGWWYTSKPTLALGMQNYREETLFCNFDPRDD